jgi:hypothetical protein
MLRLPADKLGGFATRALVAGARSGWRRSIPRMQSVCQTPCRKMDGPRP